jgi:hypothetical protein
MLGMGHVHSNLIGRVLKRARYIKSTNLIPIAGIYKVYFANALHSRLHFLAHAMAEFEKSSHDDGSNGKGQVVQLLDERRRAALSEIDNAPFS